MRPARRRRPVRPAHPASPSARRRVRARHQAQALPLSARRQRARRQDRQQDQVAQASDQHLSSFADLIAGDLAEDHLVVGGARRDHREAVLGLFDAAIEQHGLGRVDHFEDRIVQLRRIIAADAMAAIGLGQLHEIGQAFGIGMRIALAMQQLLPLAHHAHPFIVEDEDLDRQVVLDGGGHLLHRHLHGGVARNVDDQRIRVRRLHADGGRQAVAHRAETARRHPAVRLVEVEELRRPHLVLADFGGDVDVLVLRQLVETLDRVLRLDQRFRGRIGEALAGAPGVDLLPPRRDVRLLAGLAVPAGGQRLQRLAAVGDDRHVDADVLVDRGRIDIDVDLLRVRREGIETARHAIVEARADAQHHIAIVHGVVGFERAMHADHAQPLRVGRRESAEAHQRGRDRPAGRFRQRAQGFGGRGTGIDDAAAGIDDRALRVRHQGDGFLDALVLRLGARMIGAVLDGVGADILALARTARSSECRSPPGRGGRWWRHRTPRGSRARGRSRRAPDSCAWCRRA